MLIHVSTPGINNKKIFTNSNSLKEKFKQAAIQTSYLCVLQFYNSFTHNQ